MDSTLRIAIIGTAGRDKTKPLNKNLYFKMALRMVEELSIFCDDIILVSGGAALADHLAVTLFLGGYVAGLELCLPCEFKNGKYADNGSKDWRVNPGYVSNLYHKKFSEALNANTLDEIQQAITKGAVVKVGKGFHDRNCDITKCDRMFAFTWGKDGPVDGVQSIPGIELLPKRYILRWVDWSNWDMFSAHKILEYNRFLSVLDKND